MTGMSKVMLAIISLTGFTCESWDTQLKKESGSSTLRGELGARFFWLCLCMAPLRLEGAKGEEEYP
jgi:hypothetical protein